MNDICCEFGCEFFENHKGLWSQAHSHLGQMGMTEWSVNGSPINTIWEILRSGASSRSSQPETWLLPWLRWVFYSGPGPV